MGRLEVEFSREAAGQYRKLPTEYRRLIDMALRRLSEGSPLDLKSVQGHKDLFTSEIVGYAMGERLTRNLINQSLLQAVMTRRPEKGLLHHSDRGSQYCSHEYQGLLSQFGLQVSMSGSGNCFDNAPMESFWGILKQELINHRHYRTRREAIEEITEYIEIFYNRQRRQAKLGYLSPAAYARSYYAGLVAA